MKDPLAIRADAVHIVCAFDGLKKYLNVTEAQMEKVWHGEHHALETQPAARHQDEHELRCAVINDLDNVYEAELYPAMRYSFIVLLHILTETQLRCFCSDLQREHNLPIAVTELKGSAIDQIKIFLTKLVGITAQKFPGKEWEQLRKLQKIRNCIVHHYGVVKECGEADKKFLKELASRHVGVSISDEGRILVTKIFCEQQLANVRTLFERLLETVGWA